MIDTVRVEYFGTWREGIPSGWKVNESRRACQAEDGTVSEKLGRMMTHEETGLRVGGNPEYATWFEVSLPRVLFGCNGYLIRTQEQLDEAIEKVVGLVENVCESRLHGNGMRCTRLDLVAQFQIEPRDMMLAHRETNHPLIRGRKSCYEGESIHFVGKERHCRIYDKMEEMTGKPGHVTRIEWQLRGEALRRDMDRDWVALRNLVLEDCYAAYRRLCLKFQPAALPKESKLYDILAAGVRDELLIGGVPIFNAWARGKHPKTVSRVRREIAKRRCETFAIDWARLLPEEMSECRLAEYYEPDPY